MSASTDQLFMHYYNFLFGHIKKVVLTENSRALWGIFSEVVSADQSLYSARFVLTASFKILP